MATFLSIIIVIDILVFLCFALNLDVKSEDIQYPFYIFLVLTIIITFGINYDLFNRINPFTINFWIIFGLVWLAINTITIFVVMIGKNSDFPNLDVSIGKIAGLVITIIGFISSILGILSFYFDYLR
jgi:hypothetical protein